MPMTRTVTTPLAALALAAFTLAAPQAFAQTTGNWTVQGPNGATIDGSGTCTNTGSGVACSRQGLWTGPQGQTRTVSRDSVRTVQGVTGQRTVTGPLGNTRTGTWQRTR